MPEGLEAIIFTSQGDMRQAVNNIQSTVSGFGRVTEENVFKVCDQPHPKMIQEMLRFCLEGDIDQALVFLQKIWDFGYSTLDIISTIFKVTKTYPGMPEKLKLDFIKVSCMLQVVSCFTQSPGNRILSYETA